MLGEKSKTLIKFLVCLVYGSTAFALEASNLKYVTLNQPHNISGGTIVGSGHMYVVDGQEPIIYKVIGMESSKPVLQKDLDLRDLSRIDNFYSFNKSSGGKVRFEGITYCSGSYYLANQANGDVVRVTGRSVAKFPINYGNVQEQSSAVGITGITSDCSHKKLYVVKQKYPNTVFEIDLTSKQAVRPIDLSGGENSPKFNISDNYFFNGKLHVLQKNLLAITIIDPALMGSGSEINSDAMKVIDFSEAAARATLNPEESFEKRKGLAEGLIVDAQHFYIFLNYRIANSTSDVVIQMDNNS